MLLVWNSSFSIICCVAVLYGLASSIHPNLCHAQAHYSCFIICHVPSQCFSYSFFIYSTNTWRKGFYRNNSLPLMVQHACRIEGTLGWGKELFSRQVEVHGGEVKEANVRAWQSPGHPIPILYCTAIYGLFLLLTDKMKNTAMFFTVVLTKSCMFFLKWL